MTEASTAKAYVVHEIVVHDPDGFAAYASQSPATVEAFGGRYIVRGGNGVSLVGAPPEPRTVVIEFPSRQAALDWFASPAYQAIYPMRAAASTSRVFVVDGVAP